MSVRGTIFDIQKFSIHDGPGIRTTVFVKGCPLSCRWCHNPESIERGVQLSFNPERCIGCGYCFAHCERGGHRMIGDRHALSRDNCIVCGACAAGCYAEGLELVGREVTVDEVIEDVLRDKPFYETSGGGMTISGGEPLLQPEFTEALLRRAKTEALHCCVETSGYGAYARLERLLPHVDLFLYDIKETDNERHKELTGRSNRSILANLRRLHKAGAAVLLRLPMVPGVNATPAHFAGIGRLARELPALEGVEIIPYHRLGESKTERLGMDAERRISAEPPTAAEINGWIDALGEHGVAVLNERREEKEV